MGSKKITKVLCALITFALIVSGSAFQIFAEGHEEVIGAAAEGSLLSGSGLALEQNAMSGSGLDTEGNIVSDGLTDETLTETEDIYEDSIPEEVTEYASDEGSSGRWDTETWAGEDSSLSASDEGSEKELSEESGQGSPDDSRIDGTGEDSSVNDSSLSDISLTDSSITDESAPQEVLLGNALNDIEEGVYVIHSALNTRMCLGIEGNSRDNNANVQLVRSNGGFGQAFYIKKVGDGLYYLINFNSGKAVHIRGAGNTAGTNVVQYNKITSLAQRWVIREASIGGYVTISPSYADLALDCQGGKADEGTNVHLNKVVNSNRQMWKLVRASGKVAKEACLTESGITKGYYTIALAGTEEQVLDVAAGSSESGANIQIYKSNGTYAQAFEILPKGNGLYKIKNVRSGKYLATANGSGFTANVVQKTENSSDASQMWYILKDPTTDNLVFKPSNAFHAVLATDNNAHVSRTNVGNINFTGVSGQYWTVHKTSVYMANDAYTPAEGTYYLYPAAASAKAIGVASGKMENCANVQLTTKTTSNALKWRVIPNGDDTYTIQNVKSGKVLDVAGGNFASGENVQQYKSNKTKAQKWVFRRTGDESGSFYIASADESLVLDISGARFITGSNAWIYSRNNTSAQKYFLGKTSVTASGWATSKTDNRYYYMNGSRVTGWKKIGGYYYYFRSSGIMARNTTVDGYRINSEGVSNKTDSNTMPGGKTLRALLTNAVAPAGKVLYIWGGGWGGIGSSVQNDSAKIGLLPTWTTFYNNHGKPGYDYTQYRWQYGMGLDCSGFTAWAVYNTIYDRDNVADIVESSSGTAAKYIREGWCYDSGNTFKPGDIVSRSGHVWICMGTCKDGSVLIMHSTPEGCQLSGTEGTAVQLATKYMKMVAPDWPFRIRQNGAGYLAYVGKATWKVDGTGILTDPDGMQNMTAEQVCKIVFGA